MDTILVRQVSRDEGRSPTVYKDTKGLWTIGDGILVDPTIEGAGLKPNEMDYITNNRLEIARLDAIEVLGPTTFSNLSPPRQRVVINMAYNLGRTGLFGFRAMIACLRAGDWIAAAHNMEKSMWFKQVGDRGPRLVKQMRTGVDQP